MAAGPTAREKPVRFPYQEASNAILRASADVDPAKAELELDQGLSEGKRPPNRNERARAEAVSSRFREGLTSSAAPRVQRGIEERGTTCGTRSSTSAETWR